MRALGLLVLVLAFTLVGAGCLDVDEGPDGAPDMDEGDQGEGDGAQGAEGGDAADQGSDGDDEGSDERAREPPDVALETFVSGLEQPTLATSPEDGTGRMFVLEQPGRVRLVEDGRLDEEAYLDLTDRIEAGGERGLLGLAFDPAFPENGRLYVSYTDTQGDSVLARFTVDDPASGRPAPEADTLLEVEQPYGNHNGGHLAFGPDGYLYYGLGDGGSGGDPEGNGQDPSTLLGSLLRLDVSGSELTAPPDNPFVDGEGHELVWAYGLRNPWRFTFDQTTGDLYIADVGQDSYEEVNHQPAGSEGGENYGWNRWEGEEPYEGDPDREGYTFPVLTYALEEGRCSVTGGYVYRGEAIPQLEGFYLYADFCTGEIWAAQQTADGWRSHDLLDTDLRISSFGEGADGELYVAAHGGSVHRIVEG